MQKERISQENKLKKKIIIRIVIFFFILWSVVPIVLAMNNKITILQFIFIFFIIPCTANMIQFGYFIYYIIKVKKEKKDKKE